MIVAPLFLEHTKIKTADLPSEFFCYNTLVPKDYKGKIKGKII